MQSAIPRWQRKRESLRRRLPALAEWIDHPLVEVMVEMNMRRPAWRPRQISVQLAAIGAIGIASLLAQSSAPYVFANLLRFWITIVGVGALLTYLGIRSSAIPRGSLAEGLGVFFQPNNKILVQDVSLIPLRLRDLAAIEFLSTECRAIPKTSMSLAALWIAVLIFLFHSILASLGKAPAGAEAIAFYGATCILLSAEFFCFWKMRSIYAFQSLIQRVLILGRTTILTRIRHPLATDLGPVSWLLILPVFASMPFGNAMFVLSVSPGPRPLYFDNVAWMFIIAAASLILSMHIFSYPAFNASFKKIGIVEESHYENMIRRNASSSPEGGSTNAR